MSDKKYIWTLADPDSGQVMLTIDTNGKVETDFPEKLDEFSQQFINQIEVRGKGIVVGHKEALYVLKELVNYLEISNVKPDWPTFVNAKRMIGYYDKK